MSDGRRLAGQVAVVTGAGQGIGKHIALRFAAEGANVVLAARARERLEATAEEIAALEAHALVVPTDVADESAVRGLADTALEEFGRVDTLVCNAGIAGPTAELWRISRDEWEEVFRVNVTGTYLCCAALLPKMLEHGSGSVIVIGSMTGKRPLYGRTPYAASKTALIGLVRTLASEIGPHGVRVNLISPGGTEGPRIDRVLEGQAGARGISYDEAYAEMSAGSPLKRLVRPEELAAAAVFLASTESAGITGEDLNVSAGLVMY